MARFVCGEIRRRRERGERCFRSSFCVVKNVLLSGLSVSRSVLTQTHSQAAVRDD